MLRCETEASSGDRPATVKRNTNQISYLLAEGLLLASTLSARVGFAQGNAGNGNNGNNGCAQTATGGGAATGGPQNNGRAGGTALIGGVIDVAVSDVLNNVEANCDSFPRSRTDEALLGNPTITFPATDKVIGDLLGGFSARHSNPIPPSLFVIDEDTRTGTLNSRLSFESHSIAGGRVPNLSTHAHFAAAQTTFSNGLEERIGCPPPPVRISPDYVFKQFSSRGSVPAPDLSALAHSS
jgi:hypothetical protein